MLVFPWLSNTEVRRLCVCWTHCFCKIAIIMKYIQFISLFSARCCTGQRGRGGPVIGGHGPWGAISPWHFWWLCQVKSKSFSDQANRIFCFIINSLTHYYFPCSISALQWLCNADKKTHSPPKRLYRFFSTLYSSLVIILYSAKPQSSICVIK